MEVQFERVTGYKLVGLGACTEWIRAGTYYHWVIVQWGQLGRCPRLAGIPLPEGPMTPPPYPPVTAAAPPVTAAPAVPAALPVTAAPPAMAVASTQATVPNPPQGGGRMTPSKVPATKKGRQVSKAPPGIREVLGTPPAGVAEQHLESPVRPGVAQRSIAGPSPGGGIPGRRLRSPSRIRKADFRPSGRYMKRPENINWPLR